MPRSHVTFLNLQHNNSSMNFQKKNVRSLPSHDRLFLLNSDKSPAWPILSDLLSNRMLCPYKGKPSKWGIFIGSKWTTALTDSWCLHHLLLVTELWALLRLWMSDWTFGMKPQDFRPSCLSPVLSSHPLHLPRSSSSSHVLTLSYTLSASGFIRLSVPVLVSPPVSYTNWLKTKSKTSMSSFFTPKGEILLLYITFSGRKENIYSWIILIFCLTQ